MYDVWVILVYFDATSNVTSEADIDLDRRILAIIHIKWSDVIWSGSFVSELSTGRMDPQVGSGRFTILPYFGGSGQHLGYFSFLLIISWYLNRYESSYFIRIY